MTKYLVDTSIFIAHLRGFTPATEFLLQEKDLIISYVTLAELMQGARNKIEVQKVKSLTSPFTINWGSETINKRALELVEKYNLSHKAHVFDMLIASTALTAGLNIITDNIKDFHFIPDLTVRKPPYELEEAA